MKKFTEYYKGDKLVEWLINLIETQYKNDIALVIRDNALKPPGYEDNIFPSFYISDTKKGKELACSFIIDRKSHDFFHRPYECFEDFRNVSHYDTMIMADSVCLYARSEEDYRKYEACKKELFENVKNTEHMKQVAIKDYKWAVEVFYDCCFESTPSNVMFYGGYVCDLLVHVIASMNNRYIPQSFTHQYEFLESCINKPENFTELYLKINRSKDIAEIKCLCEDITKITGKFFGYGNKIDVKNLKSRHGARKADLDVNGLAAWYEEIILDWERVRRFAKCNEPRNVRGWATKLQYSLYCAEREHGIKEYPLLEKFDESDMTEYFEYADWVESDIRRILSENNAHLNEFNTVDEFIEAYKENRVRK